MTKTKIEVEQGSLPGMGDRAIAELNQLATNYAKLRDQRIALGMREVELREQIRQLMHRKKKTHYRHGRIEIDLKPEGEKVKVKIHSEDDDNEE
jgi:hypothetical protein